ncbi:MAG: DUF177 domain-containing protein [Rhizobiaceae bacterium]
MVENNETLAPFTMPINVRTLPKKGKHLNYSAPEPVLITIAKAYDLISVEDFKADCLITPWKRDGVELRGTVRANITQPCAITAAPLQAIVKEKVEMFFVPDGSKLAKPRLNEEGEWVFDIDGTEIPDTYLGDSIDMAAVWLEFFSMGIDFFARLDGAEIHTVSPFEEEGIRPESPFAALAALKKH